MEHRIVVLEKWMQTMLGHVEMMLGHVRSCEEMGRRAARERAHARHEARAFGIAILAAVISSIIARHGLFGFL